MKWNNNQKAAKKFSGQGTIGLIVQPSIFKWIYTKVRTLSKIYVRGYYVTKYEHNFQHIDKY